MARISIQAAKSKGRRAQQWVRDAILARFPTLEPGDVVSCSMGAGGVDVALSPAARKLLPISVEVKARANGFTPIYAALAQANRKDGLTPIAFIKQDRKAMIAVIDAETLLDLLARTATTPSP